MMWRLLARIGLASMTSLVLLAACASAPSGGHGYPVTIDEIPDH
jgi:hypothetical protein